MGLLLAGQKTLGLVVFAKGFAGLEEAGDGSDVVANIRSSSTDLPSLAEVFCEDPDVLDDLRAALAE